MNEFAGVVSRLDRPWVRYGGSLAIVGLALLLRLALSGLLGDHLPFVTFYPTVVVAALVGGLGPGLVATVIAWLMAAYWVVHPVGRLSPLKVEDALGLVVFAIMGVVVSLVSACFYRAWREVAAKERVLAALEGEQRFRQLADNIAQLAWMADRDGSIFWYNQRWFEFTGTTLEQMQGWGWQAVYHPDHVTRVVEKFRHCIQTGEPWEDTFPLRGKDGVYRWFLSRAIPIRDAGGMVVRWFGTNTDVTEQREVAEALARQTRELEKVVRLLDFANVMVLDLDGTITRWNTGCLRLFGFTAEQAVGRVSHQLLRTRFPEPLENICATLLAQGRWEGEVVHTRADGAEIVLASEWVLQRDEAGEPVAVLAVNTDISERKRAEENIRKADRHKSEFLAMLSHELRNPLAPIMNSLFILDRVPPHSEQARHARAIMERQVNHMKRLIDDLLDVTRISRGKMHLRQEPFELNELVRGTVEDFASVFTANGVHLDARLSPVDLCVHGDRVRLAQVVGNLLHNAAKFTPRGGRTGVALTPDPTGTQAVLDVTDTGAGIAPELLPELFKPFMQVKMTLDRSTGGLGLGLALVKGLVEMHGGTVKASSDGTGKGSRFTVCLPLEHRACENAADQSRLEPVATARRVLVIEDNADAAETLRDALELLHHQVEVANTGPEGIDKVAVFHPDVVLCDIGLPGMDGYAVARAMRSQPQSHPIKLIALTGYASSDDVARSRDAGFDQHLAKPPSMEALERMLVEEGEEC